MRGLLDVNVLIALLDANHIAHQRAVLWLTANIGFGWASCPITQNGCLRIMSQPAYPNRLPFRTVCERLEGATASAHHDFWADDLSLLDQSRIRRDRIHQARAVTDVYLLALAVQRQGRLVTLDHAIDCTAVAHAEPAHLIFI
jgi:toxin-antitoxin system PIN domain toxin